MGLGRLSMKCAKCKKVAKDEEIYDWIYKPGIGWLCKKCKDE